MKASLLAGLLMTTSLAALAQGVSWVQASGIVQFGVTAEAGGVAEQFPSALGVGYQGAWIFGSQPQYVGMGQVFTVPSLRTLQSVELRVGGFNGTPCTGQFEVAIYEFDTSSATPTRKLAGVLGNADDYWRIDAGNNVPVSSFSFSGLGVELSPTKNYALCVDPTATFAGGSLTLQGGGPEWYSGGSAYMLEVVPEPSAVALYGLGFACLGLVRRRRLP